MSSPVIPIAAVAPPPLPSSIAHAPVTAEEAAALARRIRVEARLSRITTIGCVLGIVCGIAAIAPFLDSNGYMAETLVNGNGLTFIPGWLLAGLLPLLAFYAGRLQYQTGRSSTGEIEGNLRKIRWIILCSMFASAFAFVFVLTQRNLSNTSSSPWMAIMYAGSFAACALIVGDVRRGLGDFDTEQQRRRRKLARGFTVELGRASAVGVDSDIPMAARATPVLPIEPVLEAEDDHFQDLRLLLTLAILIGVGIHAVRLGQEFAGDGRAVTRVVEILVNNVTNSSAGLMSSLEGMLALLSVCAMLLLLVSGVLWLTWGVLALNFGPAFRRFCFWLTISTAVFAILGMLPAWLYGMIDDSDRITRTSRLFRFTDRLSRAPEFIHAALMYVLLTRPGVKRLFSRGNEI
jgi:hypothetical protein